MTDRDSAEKPTGLLLGRELIIVIVILFSGLSFTLGFFVGRSSGPYNSSSLQASENPVSQKQEVTPAQTPEPVMRPEEQPQPVPIHPAPVQQIQPVQPTQPTEPVSRNAAASGTPEQKQKAEVKSAAPQQDKKTETAPAKTPAVKTAQKTETAVQPEEKQNFYTVQLGAFKNPSDAKQLKSKFDKKGFKTFIAMVKDNKGHKVYKVRTGDFREKKEAEVLALKLKKTEGLNTYVTTRND